MIGAEALTPRMVFDTSLELSKYLESQSSPCGVAAPRKRLRAELAGGQCPIGAGCHSPVGAGAGVCGPVGPWWLEMPARFGCCTNFLPGLACSPLPCPPAKLSLSPGEPRALSWKKSPSLSLSGKRKVRVVQASAGGSGAWPVTVECWVLLRASPASPSPGLPFFPQLEMQGEEMRARGREAGREGAFPLSF